MKMFITKIASDSFQMLIFKASNFAVKLKSLFGSHEELYSGRPYGALDSGFNSVDSGDKRWSGNEVSGSSILHVYDS